MKRFLCCLMLLLSFSFNAFAMDANFWQVLSIPNEFEFQIPYTMMLEENSASQFYRLDGTTQIDKELDLLFVPNKRITKRNLNAKVVLHIMVNDDAIDYPKWGESLRFSDEELENWQKEYIKYFEDKALAENTGEKFYSMITSAFIMNINGKDAITLVFTSNDEKDRLFYNFVFDFYNGTHVYSFLISIPFNELEYWTRLDTDLRDIIKTVKPL